jgi:hypothetical protein
MDAFSYLSVLLSIILGLAIAQVLQGYRALLLAKRRVLLSLPVLIWSGLVLLFATQAWWASFGLRERPHWDFIAFAVILLQMALLYMLAGLVFPDIPAAESTDLVAHFEQHRRGFFGILIAMLATSITKDLILDHKLPSGPNLGFHAFLAAGAIIGILDGSRRVQVAVALLAVAGFVAYVALLFARL